MLAKRVIACLDVRGGRVVKGRRFEELRDAGDPQALARSYSDQGFDEIVLLDVSATLESRLAFLETVALVSDALNVPLTVGGGVRSADDAGRLLDAGADKVAINSAAVADPEIITRCAQRFGSQCIVLSIDVRRCGEEYRVATHSAQRDWNLEALAWAARGEALGAGEVLLTAIDRDGGREGFDLALIREAARSVGVPLVASGGARDAASFADAFSAGADAALGASVFHWGELTASGVKSCCAGRGLTVRS